MSEMMNQKEAVFAFQNNVISEAIVVHGDSLSGGWNVIFVGPSGRQWLLAKTLGAQLPRSFSSLDTARTFLAVVGIKKFMVDGEEFKAGE